MARERRTVEITAGHRVSCARVRTAASRPGYVRVRTSGHRPPFDVPADRWEAGEPS